MMVRGNEYEMVQEYLQMNNLPLGLIIRFTNERVVCKRVVNVKLLTRKIG
jgi:hypothetical protein